MVPFLAILNISSDMSRLGHIWTDGTKLPKFLGDAMSPREKRELFTNSTYYLHSLNESVVELRREVSLQLLN